jgi:hypothetical protein
MAAIPKWLHDAKHLTNSAKWLQDAHRVTWFAVSCLRDAQKKQEQDSGAPSTKTMVNAHQAT